MNLDEQLKNLYLKRIADFKLIPEKFPNDDLAGPLLISPNPLYENQPIRLMIIGQQTNGWDYYVDDLDCQMKVYKDFNLGIDYYSSPFWNITRKLENILGNKEYSCVWTNINKFDLNNDKPYGNYEIEISAFDSLLIDEIDILKPDVCIFFTGPYFDYRIKSIFTNIIFDDINGWDKRLLSKLKHPKLPSLSFRTHHPKSLRIRHFENPFIEYIEKQIKIY